MSIGFGLLFYVNWRIGLGAGLIYWATLIHNSLDDESPSSTFDRVKDNEELDSDYKYRTKA